MTENIDTVEKAQRIVYNKRPIINYVVSIMTNIIEKLQHEVRSLCTHLGHNKTWTPFVTAWRFTSDKIQMPQTDNPYLYIILDGMLRLYTPSGIMDYVAEQYSVSKIDTPMYGTVLSFSKHNDFLAISIEFTVNDVITSVLGLDNDMTNKIINESLKEQSMSEADDMVIKSAYRFFPVMRQTLMSEFLIKNITQEIIYYLLCGSCGRLVSSRHCKYWEGRRNL